MPEVIQKWFFQPDLCLGCVPVSVSFFSLPETLALLKTQYYLPSPTPTLESTVFTHPSSSTKTTSSKICQLIEYLTLSLHTSYEEPWERFPYGVGDTLTSQPCFLFSGKQMTLVNSDYLSLVLRQGTVRSGPPLRHDCISVKERRCHAANLQHESPSLFRNSPYLPLMFSLKNRGKTVYTMPHIRQEIFIIMALVKAIRRLQYFSL